LHTTRPQTDKLALLSLGDNEDQLTNAYSVTMRLVEMAKHFKWFDLRDWLYIVKTTVDDTEGTLEPTTSPAALYLFDDYIKILTNDVHESTRLSHPKHW